MAETTDRNVSMEDEYDEEADSDFDGEDLEGEDSASSSDEGGQPGTPITTQAKKRRTVPTSTAEPQELDSGDEATIKEQQKRWQKKKKQGGDTAGEDGNGPEEWRARTRAMRIAEKDERRRNKLATSKGSTIDVDKIWEEMNRPGPLVTPQSETPAHESNEAEPVSVLDDGDKENVPRVLPEDMITIKRSYKFAGEIHTEEKVVPKSSAEARLWLAQQNTTNAGVSKQDNPLVQRPLRKISRFDPNVSNLDAFRSSWADQTTANATFKGPKLNVVEKSKMDWAQHVDTEGLKDELEIHAKAKEGYLSRMDFLTEVERRKEDEARNARVKGR